MSADGEREDQALDALIVAALRPDLRGDVPTDVAGPEPALSDEDRRALDALGPDLAERLARGERPGGRPRPRKNGGGRWQLAGSLNRGEGEEPGEEAREEMERKRRELDAEEPGELPP